MDQFDLLKLGVEVLERLAVPYALVGSWGSGFYGEPRMTQDIDIVFELSMPHVEPFCRAFEAADVYVSEAAVRDSVKMRFPFNVVDASSGNKIDFNFPRGNRWNRSQLERSRRVKLIPTDDGLMVNMAAPEDVILGKLWYYSEGGGDRHLRDIAGILRVSSAIVDRAYVERWATELGYLDVWKKILANEVAPDRPPGPGVPG